MKNIMITMVLIFFIFTSTTAVYGQFRETDENVLDSISEFYLVESRLVSDDGSTLIPEGQIRSITDVYYIEYEYEVVVKDGMDLQVMIDDLMFSNDLVSKDDLRNTFRFDIKEEVVEQLDYSEHLLGKNIEANRVKVTVRVSMVEPDTYELYQQLIKGNLTYEVYFFAV